MNLKAQELELLRELAESPRGEKTVSGNQSHKIFKRLVIASYVTEKILNLDTVLYSITSEGKEALGDVTLTISQSPL